jgi:hypothetical protein
MFSSFLFAGEVGQRHVLQVGGDQLEIGGGCADSGQLAIGMDGVAFEGESCHGKFPR